ncbi:hypothetical protein DRE_06546 [Drechslerella stenobrocha 248]|uniref:BZIP domain-containing protein n=1 Tax=Drechslerella stenobrocha 248 TaxID=1043628 RepID=W7I6W2_9PEZI|nr:hypothetical protein DRE_06546 [Drechslerella stenobrocha 248]
MSHPPHSPASSSDGSISGSESERLDEDSRHTGPNFGKSEPAYKPISLQPFSGAQYSQGAEPPAISPTAHSPEQRASRPLDMNRMLNPTPVKTGQGDSATPSTSRRRNADEAELDTPQRISSTPQQPPFTRSLPPSPTDRYYASEMYDNTNYAGSLSRRSIKQPVPPSSRQREGLLPMIETHQPPVSGAGTPPRGHANLASPATAGPMQQAGGFPFPPINGPPGLTQAPHSQPSMVASPNSSPFSRSQQPPSLPTGYTHPSPVYSMNPHFHDGLSQPMAQTSSQHSYHGLHISGLDGLAIPVDTTAASKLADEKRKRNAGASARFRQRRKEREREMSTRIVELETRLKVIEEERDHYRNLAMKYAGTPLPNTISTSLANVASNVSRHNSHGLQLSPRTMARANQQHLMNEGPYTSPSYAHVREDNVGSPGVPLGRTMSTEGRRVGRAYSAGQVYPGGAPMNAVPHDGPDRPLDAYNMKTRNGSFNHNRPHTIPEHYGGRDPIKPEWSVR